MPPKILRFCAILGFLTQVVFWIMFAFGFTVIARILVAPSSAPGNDASTSAILERAEQIALWGKLIGIIGFVLLLIVVLNGRKQARWIWWSGLFSSGIQFFMFPLGTTLGGVGLLLFMRRLRRSDEEEPNQPAEPMPLKRHGSS
jgi:hypothetical protein